MISVVFEEPRDEVFEETFPQSHWARVTKVLPHRRFFFPAKHRKQRSFNTLVVFKSFPMCTPQKPKKLVLFSMLFPFGKGPGIKLPSRWWIEVCG